jgi:hypothetical protein
VPSTRVTDKERRDGQLNLVRQPGGKELGVYDAAAFNHEPANSAGSEIIKHRREVQRLARAGHLREIAEPGTHLAHCRIGGLHELFPAGGRGLHGG